MLRRLRSSFEVRLLRLLGRFSLGAVTRRGALACQTGTNEVTNAFPPKRKARQKSRLGYLGAGWNILIFIVV